MLSFTAFQHSYILTQNSSTTANRANVQKATHQSNVVRQTDSKQPRIVETPTTRRNNLTSKITAGPTNWESSFQVPLNEINGKEYLSRHDWPTGEPFAILKKANSFS